MGHLTFNLNYRRFPSYFLCTFLIFPFHLLPSPVNPTGFSPISSLASFPFSSCCHRTTTTYFASSTTLVPNCFCATWLCKFPAITRSDRPLNAPNQLVHALPNKKITLFSAKERRTDIYI